MAKVFIEETTLTAIGDAIRGKTGKTDLIDPANMGLEIEAIEAGGGGEGPTDEDLCFTGNCQYAFANNRWNWALKLYGNRITTKDIDSPAYMFYQASDIEEIPFQINLYNASSLNYVFNYCSSLKVCPKVRGTIGSSYTSWNFDSLLDNCRKLRNVEDLFTPDMLNAFEAFVVTNAYSTPRPLQLKNMSSLRTMPTWWYKFRLNETSSVFPSNYYILYRDLVYACYSLDEIANIPVWRTSTGGATSNFFNDAFQHANRLKAITFETNIDGSPISANWSNQVIDLSYNTGYSSSGGSASYVVQYNSGITVDKEVQTAEQYQALKNDPDWWTPTLKYCRYNHDSAVETINSLPDTSAYLATAGGTNTIKFMGAAGSATDGGAINTLTEEEIAVATAKGWTVTLV